MKRIQSILTGGFARRLPALSELRSSRFAVLTLAVLLCSFLIAVPTVFLSSGGTQKGSAPAQGTGKSVGQATGLKPYVSQAVEFHVTPALRDVVPELITPEQREKIEKEFGEKEKNEQNARRVKPEPDPKKTAPFLDPALNNSKHTKQESNVITNPIANFDGPDMDAGAALFGGRFAPPDTNAAVGPNHVVVITNGGLRIYDKAGNPLTAQFRLSQVLIGVPFAADDDGDPIAVYDSLSDRWILSQFNLRFDANNSMHMHIAVSMTGDPTGAYFAYDFPLTPGRFGDYPHMGVWPDGYYIATNDFNTSGTSFLGAGFYSFERAKMLTGDPTAKIIGFNSGPTEGGFLPTNLQGFTPPPVGTPNLFIEFDADEFGAATDLIRVFQFHVDFATPPSSTLIPLPDIPTAPFDARNPSGRADIAQPSPGEGLDAIADRLMHALNFRVLSGGVQSYVLNFTVNVSGVAPTSSALYQAGVRWMELRRNAGTGAVTINQEATYAPGSGSGTGRDLWMASVAQDGEGNIALAASASAIGPSPPALNPTAIYTGRLAGDPANTLPQGEVDALSAVTRGVQTATANRWGDYSSLFVDPADECTFWGAFEYVDAPTATFDWNTRAFSFKVNPTCVTAPRGTINGTITNCVSGQPIPNAVITTAEGFFRQTDASGQFSATVAPGTYTVMVSGPAGSGFGTCTQMVTVAAGGTGTVNCCLQPSPVMVGAGATIVTEGCTPSNGVLDPGETVTVSLCVQNTGGADTVALMGTLQATGGVTGIQAPNPQDYGIVVAGGGAVCRDFTFTAAGTCGGTVTASLQLQDGMTNLGTVTYTFTLGVLSPILTENFDGVTAPALPAGWTTSFVNGGTCTMGTNWATVTTNTPPSLPNAAFHNDPNCITDNLLVSPGIPIGTPIARVSFSNAFALETNFDGAVLEVSSPNINGGAFTDITNAAVGGSFVSGGYNGTISTNFSSPIAGRQAWTNLSGGTTANPTYITSVANLGPNVAGQTIQLRWRVATDSSVSRTGQWIDDVVVSDGVCCTSGAACTLTCPANITQGNDPDQCGAVVNYPAPTTTGDCGTVTCAPASGSFFPIGTTTVTCTGTGATCDFTVTVNDTQPPSITCPANITAITDQSLCVGAAACQTVNFVVTATDNCPGVTVVCVPPSGSCFATGTTTVTCTATDASGNTDTCSFTVTTFDVALQDDSDPSIILLWNSATGEYRFCCKGTTYLGTGKSKIQGCVFTLQHNSSDRRVLGRVDKTQHSGTASIQAPPGGTRCTITDRDTLNDTNLVCQ